MVFTKGGCEKKASFGGTQPDRPNASQLIGLSEQAELDGPAMREYNDLMCIYKLTSAQT